MTAFTRRNVVAAASTGTLATAAAGIPAAAFLSLRAERDPVLDRIELHVALRDRANAMPGEDDDPDFVAACSEEEAALQALGDLVPTSIAGAAALLAHMADAEESFADSQSPLVRTMRVVARGLTILVEGGAHA